MGEYYLFGLEEKSPEVIFGQKNPCKKTFKKYNYKKYISKSIILISLEA